MIDTPLEDSEQSPAILRRVLVIDDNPDIPEIITRTLGGTEYSVISAPDGRVGIQLAKEQRPDIIILDITMPGFDGFMTAKVIKRNQDTKDIPIIFLSGRKTKQDIHAAILAGGADYIVKPFSPHDLLSRVRKTMSTIELERKRAAQAKGAPLKSLFLDERDTNETLSQDIQSFTRFGDIIVCPTITPSIAFNTHSIYRGLFANLISDGFLNIVLDASTVELIDGAGLALLVSTHEALQSHEGSLRIVLPQQALFEQVSYAKLNDLFDCYDSVLTAVESYQDTTPQSDVEAEQDYDICMACSRENDHDARYCKYCGSNLIISKGIKTLDVIRKAMTRSFSAARSALSSTISPASQQSMLDENIPSEYVVTFNEGQVEVQYKASLSDTTRMQLSREIGISAPTIRTAPIPLQSGMAVTMRNTLPGSSTHYETVVTGVNFQKGIIYVRYTDEAKILFSQKNFSVAPKTPITIQVAVPSLSSDLGLLEAKTLELSRTRMVVFSDEHIPEKECLALRFELPGTITLSSPLAVASKKRKEKYLYDIEFVLIDEREQSKLIQYMYKRQIELAKSI